MKKVQLGRTGLMVTKTSFGALPIQRAAMDDAVAILRRAYEAGINFFDTARSYTDSEEKLRRALGPVRKDVILATKAVPSPKEKFLELAETSLRTLGTDYVDLLQIHNAGTLPDPDDPDGPYAGLLEARRRGWCRYIGLTTHKVGVAEDAARSGLYDTIQYPFNYLSSAREEALVELCRQENLGFIAMKSLSGGLIHDVRPVFAFMRRFPAAVPIYGIQKMEELEQFLALEKDPPVLDGRLQEIIDADRRELAGNFCRGCGYCLPCPAGIRIPMAARMSLLLRRSPTKRFLGPEGEEIMSKVEDCIHCNHCKDNCPYQLDTPALLVENLRDYRSFRTGANA